VLEIDMMSFTNPAFYTLKNRRADAVNVVNAIALGECVQHIGREKMSLRGANI
jgi:hypothetical protein